MDKVNKVYIGALFIGLGLRSMNTPHPWLAGAGVLLGLYWIFDGVIEGDRKR